MSLSKLGDSERQGSKLGVLPSMGSKSWTQLRDSTTTATTRNLALSWGTNIEKLDCLSLIGKGFICAQSSTFIHHLYFIPILLLLLLSHVRSCWFSKVILRHCPSDLSSADFLMLVLLSCCSLWAWILIFLTQHPFQKSTVSLTCPNECCYHNGIHLPNYWKVTPSLKTFDTCQYTCSGVCLLWNDDIKRKQVVSNW